MTSEKRDMSTEHDQEELHECATQNAGDENPSVRMRVSKKALCVLVAGLFATGISGAFISVHGEPDKESNLSIVEVTGNGISVNPGIAK